MVCEVVKKAAARTKDVDTVIIPPAVYLAALGQIYATRSIQFGIQHIHREAAGGPHTGDISAAQAKDAGATHVLIGHAERRALGETDDDVRAKVAVALAVGLTPIICIGERERDQSGAYLEHIKLQLTTALADVKKTQAKHVVIAYEPVWAIGAKEPIRPEHMHEMTIFIRKMLWEMYAKAGRSVPVLYGGAILSAPHAVAMAKESEVDGFLVGRMSVDTEQLPLVFSALAKI